MTRRQPAQQQQEGRVTLAVPSGWCLDGIHAGCRWEFQSIARPSVTHLCPCRCHRARGEPDDH